MRRRLHPGIAVDYKHLKRNNMAHIDHVQRTLVTGASVAFLQPRTILDPAVGDGSILEAAYHLLPFEKAYLSDLSSVMINSLSPSFPNERAVRDIYEALEVAPHVDVIVLTEILEHLADPDSVLRLARAKADRLVASSPIEEPEGVGNHEHLWSFGRDGYRDMLIEAGWNPFSYTEVGFTDPSLYYTFQIWTAR